MHLDPIMLKLVTTTLAILALGILMRRVKQPYVVSYLLVGILLGPHGFGIITDQETLTRLGSFGVVMLLFFVGMEISPKQLRANWFIPTVGTLLQVVFSFLTISLPGMLFGWSLEHILMLSFVFTLSSTAVILKLLSEWGELHTRIGQHVVGILLIQDLAFIPMVIILGIMAGDPPSLSSLVLQGIGGFLLILLAVILTTKEDIRLPIPNWLIKDHEMQVFAALAICFGVALFTGLLGLSAALGAFFGGMLIAATKQTQWIHHSLGAIRVVFIALFFVSIGMLIDLKFIKTYWAQVSIIVLVIFFLNTLINTLILRFLKESWRLSLYGGSLLAQLGEFGFVISSVGFHMHIVSNITYQLIISVIAITLLLSPAWIALIKWITGCDPVRLRGNADINHMQ